MGCGNSALTRNHLSTTTWATSKCFLCKYGIWLFCRNVQLKKCWKYVLKLNVWLNIRKQNRALIIFLVNKKIKCHTFLLACRCNYRRFWSNTLIKLATPNQGVDKFFQMIIFISYQVLNNMIQETIEGCNNIKWWLFYCKGI